MTVESNDVGGRTAAEEGQYRIDADERASMAVVRAVASVSGRSPVVGNGGGSVLEPLNEAIDPEALDTAVESADATEENPFVVEFEYCDYRVTVCGTDSVRVTAA